MLKVFKMNDFDWVAAQTWKEAKDWYLELTGFDEEDIFEKQECDIQKETILVEYTKRLGQYILENNIETTIKGQRGLLFVEITLEQVLDFDDETNEPYVIASTEF